MKVALIQLRVEDQEKRENIRRATDWLERARGADLVLLPELWNIGYFSFERYATEAEPLDGETVTAMAAQARQLEAYLLAGSIIERAGDCLYNTSVLLNPDGMIAATYRKANLFSYGSRERALLKPGEKPGVARTELGTLGIATCYDLRFPELFRQLVEADVECFLIVSAWPYPRLEHWKLFNRVRAVENLCYLVSCNCVGVSNGRQLLGHSMIVDPWGIPVAMAGDREGIVRGEVDLGLVAEIREEFPVLKERLAQGCSRFRSIDRDQPV